MAFNNVNKRMQWFIYANLNSSIEKRLPNLIKHSRNGAAQIYQIHLCLWHKRAKWKLHALPAFKHL